MNFIQGTKKLFQRLKRGGFISYYEENLLFKHKPYRERLMLSFRPMILISVVSIFNIMTLLEHNRG